MGGTLRFRSGVASRGTSTLESTLGCLTILPVREISYLDTSIDYLNEPLSYYLIALMADGSSFLIKFSALLANLLL
jgi:hypothetical protein